MFLIAMLTAISVTAQSKMRIIEKSGSKTVVELNDVESINLFQEPWSNWQEAGTASYTYSVYWSGTLNGAYVRYRENLVNKNGAQFLFTNMAGGYDLTIEYDKETGNCQVHQQQVADNSNYGPVFVSDIPHYPGQPGLSYEDYPCTYNAETGQFSLTLVYFVDPEHGSNYSSIAMFGKDVETIQMDGFRQYDYGLSLTYEGQDTNENGEECAVINVTMGADLPSCALAVVRADEDTDATVAGILDGSIDYLVVTESTSVTIPLAKSGTYKAVAATFDENATMLDVYTMEFEFTVDNGDDNWVSLGMATYTDDLILPLFGNDPMSYNVEVLENKEKPGLFRIVDPYGPEFPLYPYASSYEEGSYIEIDATDPDGVWIEGWQSTGIDIANNGLMDITSMAWYQAVVNEATQEDVKEAGLCGVFADGVITFPVDGVLVGINSKAYYGNRNGAFRLDMSNLERPAQTEEWKSIGMATYTEDCVTTYFNVENVSYQVEVREKTDQPGLYRIINPYGAAYPYNEEGDYDTSKEYFIEIDATDPEGVYMPGIYGTGMNWGYGEFSISSLAYYYMATNGATFEEVKDAGYCGVLADGVITFPAKSLLISLAEYNGGNFYYANNNGAFRLDMSDMTPVEAAPAKAAAARISAKRELDINADILQAVMPRITLKINPAMEFETPLKRNSTMKKAQTAREMFRTDAVIGIKDGGVARIKRVNENEDVIIDK